MSLPVSWRRRCGAPKPLCLAPLALAFALTTGALGAQSVPLRVQRVWGPVAPDEGAFQAAAPRPGGGALAASGSRVWSVDAQGKVSPLGGGDLAFLNPGGDTYALLREGRIEVFDGAGAALATYPADQPLPLFKLIPGTPLLYAPRVRVAEETPVVEKVRILGPGAAPVGDFAAPEVEATRFDDDRIVYSQGGRLYARRLDGGALWQADFAAGKFETASDRTIAVPRHTRGQVTHLLRGERVAAGQVDGVVWNLAIAPDGRTSAATTRNALALFREGKTVAQVRLDLAYANSLSVSDRGEALVGGQDGKAGGRLVLLDPAGRVLWSKAVGTNRGGYRPEVRFAPRGEGFLVLEEGGLSYYRIERNGGGAQ